MRAKKMYKSIEDKWMERWEKQRVFESDPDPTREKKFVTFPFPYMNGPLHIGHAFTSVRVDVYARYKRMQGFDVLFPWAWHWTGQPIVAAAERLANGDKAMVKEFVEIDGISQRDIHKFYDPKYMAQYYTDSGRVALKRLGLSIDWRREFHTTDLDPTFNKFVIWQYNKLREKGYVTQGTHPVVWCPRDQSPTGDHDRVQGEGVTWEEYTLVMFRLDGEDIFLPAATFRPETIYGVTNLWLNPEAEYTKITVDGKYQWIVSKEAAAKLKDQLRKITTVKTLKGKELIGRYVTNPLRPGDSLPILPAEFVDPKNGTGVVYSVPAHAPMDYIALRDIQSDLERQRLFSLNAAEVKAIEPISLVTVAGMSRFPAQQVIEEMKIKDQNDPKVAAATAEVYKKEFHQGVLNENTGKYKGKKITDAKSLIIEELKQSDLASSMYDLPDKVVCRCLTECIVKVLEDQWFLKYSDPEWKKLAHQCVDGAEIYPESARQWFHDVVDWIKDWPCARKVGLGTPLDWSPGWIVETLSDSTIYMAFYTIRPAMVRLEVPAKSLTDEFFNYVFLGEGTVESLSKNIGMKSQELELMRREFLYWYPVNLRNSAKELIPNHLLFFVFQHAAFFPRELWPKGISANGMMTVEGEKMSKSKGNVITISNALQTYGADALRSGLMDGAEGMDDVDWRDKNARDIQAKINALPSFIKQFENSATESKNMTLSDLWLENQIQKRIASVSLNLDMMKTKSAFQEVFYAYWNDLRYYLLQTEVHPSNLINCAVDTWVKLLAPFLPYTVEEINESRGRKEMVCSSSFPKFDESKLHADAELGELLLQKLVEDSKNILKLMPQQMKSIHIYIAPEWQYDLFSEAVKSRKSGGKTSDILQQFFVSHPTIEKKDAANSMTKIGKNINDLGENFLDNYSRSREIEEAKLYGDSVAYIQKQLGLAVTVHSANEAAQYDPKGKAKFAMPFKPALYIE
ncbi:MAG: leucine--tRNA ligase [Nitrososphaerales archaeon]